jgi:alanine racemase
MDITMIDITGIENVQLGDRVVVFGAEGGIFKLSKVNNTIPYEIISRISERVNRTYVE